MILNMFRKIICYWFGHEPDRRLFGDGQHTSCQRCGIWDIPYHDLVMPSRYKWLKEELKFWFYFRWIVKRFKKTSDPIDDDELPF